MRAQQCSSSTNENAGYLSPYEEVVLLDVGGHGGEAGGADHLTVGSPLPGHLQTSEVPEEESVEQGGLPRPAGPHDGQELPWSDSAAH